MDVQIEKTNNKRTEKTREGSDKVARYGWKMQDEPGEFRMIDKRVLQIDEVYQRDINESRSNEFASDWSWLACGALIVAERWNLFYVVDGQHRLIAARKRSDISHVPCLIFKSTGREKEAGGFVVTNVRRKAPKSLDMHKARVVSGDEMSVFVEGWVTRRGFLIKNSRGVKSIRCVNLLVKMARQDIGVFEIVMDTVLRLCGDQHDVNEKLIDGLRYLHVNTEGGLSDKRLMGRVEGIGARGLMDAAMRAAAYYTEGGPNVWAAGMLKEINKGLQRKFEFKPGRGIKS